MKEKSLFADYLSRQGLRMTGQREVILDEFLLSQGHHSAEELTAAVKKKDKTIGQATVYRILRIFLESGIAREVRFGDGVVRYERNIGHEHHHHLTCERCGKIVEVPDRRLEEMQKKLAKDHGFVMTRHEMNIYGICRECRET
ncbi:MAG: Peroxide-responsive repressor PerR [Syntrophorhabdaceae bacterium PtaU1.Bin034]|jgi:Fur family ferric uptake transcriptional regulator|nr:MAG: Peroxide-responsive repressor PerR [Syntrophorhabdaceae bacterium PtaU1.Bin034]